MEPRTCNLSTVRVNIQEGCWGYSASTVLAETQPKCLDGIHQGLRRMGGEDMLLESWMGSLTPWDTFFGRWSPSIWMRQPEKDSVVTPALWDSLCTGLYLNRQLYWGNVAHYSGGTFINVERHFWSTQLRELRSTGIKWVEPRDATKLLQFTV